MLGPKLGGKAARIDAEAHALEVLRHTLYVVPDQGQQPGGANWDGRAELASREGAFRGVESRFTWKPQQRLDAPCAADASLRTQFARLSGPVRPRTGVCITLLGPSSP